MVYFASEVREGHQTLHIFPGGRDARCGYFFFALKYGPEASEFSQVLSPNLRGQIMHITRESRGSAAPTFPDSSNTMVSA